MDKNEKLLTSLIDKIESMEKDLSSGFRGINKRLDGIKYELTRNGQ